MLTEEILNGKLFFVQCLGNSLSHIFESDELKILEDLLFML